MPTAASEKGPLANRLEGDNQQSSAFGEFEIPKLPKSMADIKCPHQFTAEERDAIAKRLRTFSLQLLFNRASTDMMNDAQKRYNDDNIVWPIVQAMLQAEHESCQ